MRRISSCSRKRWLCSRNRFSLASLTPELTPMGEWVEVMVVDDDDVVVDPDVLVTVVDDALFMLLLFPGLGSDEVELLKTDWPLRLGVDMGEVEGVAMLLLLLMNERGWDGERWFLSKGLLPVLLCEYVVERVACVEGAEEEWEIT